MERMSELDEWKQAAGVEAGLRREFLARAEKAEAEIERLRVVWPPVVVIIIGDIPRTIIFIAVLILSQPCQHDPDPFRI